MLVVARLVAGEKETASPMQALVSKGAQAQLKENADIQMMEIVEA